MHIYTLIEHSNLLVNQALVLFMLFCLVFGRRVILSFSRTRLLSPGRSNLSVAIMIIMFG